MTTAKQTRPNILLITSDQHHHSCLGVTNPKLKTPALDRLANEGTRFDRAYTPNPVCTPTRASIITGLYPSVHGAWTIGVKLPEDVPTVGTTFSLNGYSTGLVVLFIAFLDELVHVLAGHAPRYEKPPPATPDEVIERAAQTGI